MGIAKFGKAVVFGAINVGSSPTTHIGPPTKWGGRGALARRHGDGGH